MKPQKILVTGASGFLGCRVVERLLFAGKVNVRALAHSPGKAARLARLPIEIAWGDITDADDAARAVEGCDVVIHCAYGTAYKREINRRVTIAGTRQIAEAAQRAGVQRFVHISSIAVYSYSPPARVSEATPFVRSGDAYCDDKIDAEMEIWKLMRAGNLPAVVLRMGNIYGPFSAPWTVRPLTHIRDGYVTLVDGGNHPSNVVFVDNAVEAILRAITNDAAVGEAFFVIDDSVTWKMLYQNYAAWLGNPPLHSFDAASLNAMLHLSLADRVRVILGDTRAIATASIKSGGQQAIRSQSYGRIVSAIWRNVPENWRSAVRGNRRAAVTMNASPAPTPRLPALSLLEIYASRTLFSNEKAKRVLGYTPRVEFEKAMAVTEQWARWARLI